MSKPTRKHLRKKRTLRPEERLFSLGRSAVFTQKKRTLLYEKRAPSHTRSALFAKLHNRAGSLFESVALQSGV